MVELVSDAEAVNSIFIGVPAKAEDVIVALVEELPVGDLLQIVLNLDEELGDYDFTEGLCSRLLGILADENKPEEIEDEGLREAVTAYIEVKGQQEEVEENPSETEEKDI